MERMNEKPETDAPKQGDRLIFSTRSYPTFGRRGTVYSENNPPKTVTDSPYYWWFVFLRLNKDYKATVENGGEGKCAAIYRDFGDIYSVNFKQWWNDHAHLFAEKRKGLPMQIAQSAAELAPFNDAEVINLVVPLTWSQRSLKKRFSQLVLSKVPKGKRGVSVEASDARYQLSGKWNIEAMKAAYAIYTHRQANLDGTEFEKVSAKGKRIVTRFSVTWADIAIRAKLPVVKGCKEGVITTKTEEARRLATILAVRHYKRAEQYIKAAASMTFPLAK